MRVSLARTIISLSFIAVGLVLAAPALGQTLQTPGGAGDTTEKKPAQMREIEDAVGFLQKGDIESCEKSLDEAVKKNPDLPPPELLMAQLMSSARQPQAMMMYLEKAVQKNPDDPEAYLQLGEISLQQRRSSGHRAGDLLRRVLRLKFRRVLVQAQHVAPFAHDVGVR